MAHQQISSRLGIPLKYYQKMQFEAPALLDKNVNNWLNQNPARRMLRIMDGNIRAFLSERAKKLPSLVEEYNEALKAEDQLKSLRIMKEIQRLGRELAYMTEE